MIGPIKITTPGVVVAAVLLSALSACTPAPTDPCATSNGGCNANATCTASLTNVAVCTCKPGYTGNGHNCNQEQEVSNPCDTNNGGCDTHATCTNSSGDAQCACNSGYIGGGAVCYPGSDPCVYNNGGCDPNADCTNSSGSAACMCADGYTGDGMTCTAVAGSPCAAANGGCDTHASCTADGANVTCQCISGYTGDGMTCAPVTNPCNTNNGGCDTHATCSSSAGIASCMCNSGYSGNGQTCTATGGSDGGLDGGSRDGGIDGGSPDGGPSSICGHPGNTGNNLGVGQFCQQDGDCSNGGGQLCTSDVNEGNADDSYFCTQQCDGCNTTSECGTGASCYCIGALGGCACVPNTCSTYAAAAGTLATCGDAGMPDAGTGTVGTLGTSCSTPGATAECTGDLSCGAISTNNMCSKTCSADADCGTNNNCFGGICWLGCDSSANNPCGRSDFVCLDNYLVSGMAFCTPDCTQEEASFCATDFGGYPYSVCDTTDDGYLGGCLSSGPDCEGNAAACGTGTACYQFPSRDVTTADAVCVDDCTQAGSASCSFDTDCPSGFCNGSSCAACERGRTCNGTSKTCQPTAVGNYVKCYINDQCVAADSCLELDTGTGNACLADCSATSCPAAPSGTATPTCYNSSACVLDCSTSGHTTCPSGQTCTTVTISTTTHHWCAPPP